MAYADLDDDQRYRALKSRDSRFDGLFIVGVRTTGIYCRPSCPTPVQPLRKNIDFFPSTAAAQRTGLRACKRCRPDASPGSPEWNLRDDLVARAMQRINQGYLDSNSVADLASELAVTERHLRRLVIEALGAPPLALARAKRAQAARTLIETTSMRFTDVAFAAGFSSLRQFNDTVRAVFDATPTTLRRARKNDERHDGGALRIRLPFRSPFASDYFLKWATARTVDGVAEVVDGALRTALRLENGGGLATLEIREAWVDCHLELGDVRDLTQAVAQCRAMLDLDADPLHIDDVLRGLEPVAPFVNARPGLRSPGSCDGFATLIFAVLGQQRSVAAARTLASRIVSRAAGGDVSPDRLRPFPGPTELGELDLSDMGLNGRPIATIHALARQFEGRTDELTPGADRDAIRDELISVKGIGPWTANYVAMRALGDPDVFLAGDLIADRAADSLGLRAASIDAASPWRSYLTHHLWAASAARKENL
jgi:AraC family transcriptional regulator of adaptative response / DNA-3-methyladenine glycosylase II